MEAILNILTALTGLTPVQMLAVVFNAAMGIVTVPISNFVKKALAAVPWLGTLLGDEGKVRGFLMPFVSGIISIPFFLLGEWLGLKLLSDASMFASVIGAFAINQTFAQAFFEFWKARKK